MAATAEMMLSDYERRVRRAIGAAFIFCLLAPLPTALSIIPAVAALRPPGEGLGTWVARSGALMTALAVFAQFKAADLTAMTVGNTFAETWQLYFKYNTYQRTANLLSLALVLIGTLVWGYGDMIVHALFGR